MSELQQIIIGADIVPTKSNIDLFINGEIERIIGKELKHYIGNNSYLICNLETPLSDTLSPIKKVGPNFSVPTSAINGLINLNINLVALANNHINDQGEQGIIQTCSTLCDVGIPYIGVGSSCAASYKPYFFSFCEKKIGVYSCVEHEFSSSRNCSSYCANTFDPLVSFDHVNEMKNICDYVIVLYHGGKEYYRYPSPYLQNVCRKFVDKGAGLVICQHSHCIGCKEEYNNASIVYGQGNFIFNKKANEYWDSSLLIKIDSSLNVDYVPIIRTDTGTRLANPKEKDTILKHFYIRSEQIMIPGFIEKEYHDFANKYIANYIVILNGKKTKLFSILNKITNGILGRIVIKLFYPKKQMLYLKNYIECESHRELLLSGINNLIDEK